MTAPIATKRLHNCVGAFASCRTGWAEHVVISCVYIPIRSHHKLCEADLFCLPWIKQLLGRIETPAIRMY